VEARGFQYKSVLHLEGGRDFHHLTFSCRDRQPLLQADDRKAMLCDVVSRAIERHRCVLFGFVFMPEHVHLLVRPQDSAPVVSRLLYSIKQPMAARVRKIETRRDPSGRGGFRFWQSGPGFDTNIRAWDDALSAVEYVHMNPVRRGIVRRPEEYRWSSCRQWLFPEELVDPVLPRVTRTRR